MDIDDVAGLIDVPLLGWVTSGPSTNLMFGSLGSFDEQRQGLRKAFSERNHRHRVHADFPLVAQ
ncbi:MAG: hypothetical protein ACI9BK_003342, partial [Acidimicrobiales bacterium]